MNDRQELGLAGIQFVEENAAEALLKLKYPRYGYRVNCHFICIARQIYWLLLVIGIYLIKNLCHDGLRDMDIAMREDLIPDTNLEKLND